MSVDTANIEEAMAGSHITEQHTFKFRGFDKYKLQTHNIIQAHKPQEDNLSQNYDLDLLDNFNIWNILSKVNNAINNGANTTAIKIVNQEHQDYYN